MWYVETRNGGRYYDVGSEYAAPKELNSVLDNLSKQGLKFRVYYTEYEFNGYHSRVSLINDGTLEEVFVHHHIVWEHWGIPYWRVEICEEHYNNKTLWDSRTGYTADKIRKVIQSYNTLALPVLTEEDWLFREIDTLHRELFGTPAVDERVKYPCAARTFMEIQLSNLKEYKRAKTHKVVEKKDDYVIDYDIL